MAAAGPGQTQTAEKPFDVIVVGGGPAGSVMGWALAKRGIRVAVLERETFPREKVCGDFVEPSGLRILKGMGCLEKLDPACRLPVTHNRVYYGPHLVHHGPIAYYEGEEGMPPHGYIIPRDQLDTVLLQHAEDRGATVFRATQAMAVTRERGLMQVEVKQGAGDRGQRMTLSAPLVVGADGVESVVGRAAGLRRTDRRHIGVARRAYLEGLEIDGGESSIWFDEDQIPGYGWMFPMPGGRANMGIGLLSETAERHGLSAPRMFEQAVERLRIRHPGCRNARLASKPIGGQVKMYGGMLKNHFDGGILVGDAGSFVDPMTGEGITQGMESSLLGAPVLADALGRGRFEAADLERYDHDFHAYFDPAMLWLVFTAQCLRNWHFREYMFRATKRGFEAAMEDGEFARVSGTMFGGLNVRPRMIAKQVWGNIFAYLAENGVRSVADLVGGRGFLGSSLVQDLAAWEQGWSASVSDDPRWHFGWLADVARSVARLGPSFAAAENPRVKGLVP
jgi:geranylgeranyl reductase family protein